MSEALYGYYERELIFIRQLSQEFARQYPAAAGRLLLEPNRSIDPHVERLIESFALLAGRIHKKLDDEFPELTDALLGVLYPHYLAPIPSMAIVQFDLDFDRGQLPDGFKIPRGSRIASPPVQDVPCKFRTGHDVILWPIQVASARYLTPPFPPGLDPPPRAAAAIRLQLDCKAGMGFHELSLETLRFFLLGEGAMAASLYESLFNSVMCVTLKVRGVDAPPIILDGDEAFGQVGFERDEGLLPYPSHSFLGYRLLTEFFAFPSKFQFADLKGLGPACRSGPGKTMDVIIYLNRAASNLEQSVSAETFRLGCAPVVNLFEKTAEPIPLTHAKLEYRVLPEVTAQAGHEVYSIDQVIGIDPASRSQTEYQPFYSFRHGSADSGRRAYWIASRRPSFDESDRGTEVYLTLVDLGFNPRLPAESTLVVRTTCTNRDLPARLQSAGDRLSFSLEESAPLSRIRCLRMPTITQRPPARRGAYWRLISHLSLNHLSLSDPEAGRQAFQEILRLYDFSDPEQGEQGAAVSRQLIDGIVGLSTRPVVGWTGSGAASGFCRGVEVSVELDEQKYLGSGTYLFASLLERFLGLYTTINSFTQLVARTRQGERPFKTWAPRAGEQPLI